MRLGVDSIDLFHNGCPIKYYFVLMRFYCPISKMRLMEHDHTKRGYSCRVSYLRVLFSRSFKVIKSMVLL